MVSINPYFQQHPEMVLGEQEIVSGPYGATACMQALSRQGFQGTSGAGSGEP